MAKKCHLHSPQNLHVPLFHRDRKQTNLLSIIQYSGWLIPGHSFLIGHIHVYVRTYFFVFFGQIVILHMVENFLIGAWYFLQFQIFVWASVRCGWFSLWGRIIWWRRIDDALGVTIWDDNALMREFWIPFYSRDNLVTSWMAVLSCWIDKIWRNRNSGEAQLYVKHWSSSEILV